MDKMDNLENYKKDETKISFLHDSVSDKIFIYKSKYTKLYSIFGFYFLVKNNTEEKTQYTCHYSKQELSDIDVSKALRGSKTLKISDHNSYDSDIKVVVCEKGFLWYDKCNFNNTNKFEKTLLLFLIALAYNKKSNEILRKVSKSYKNNSFNEMINTRNEIYDFDLNCFFSNPVKQDRHQLYDIWSIIEKNYHVNDIHNEIKMQVVELTNLIESKKRYKFATRLTIIGLFLSAASLIGIIKDLKELFG
ncbi:hypothetical protein OFO07_03565 [Campylobacter sp. JMF_06 NA1]|uniref:hypothetical protein n=1 Tax=Campylobacter sp. JMF_06 NA1 TaxID=2983823 RepID=UPI0022E9D2C1|nr:hypothetical protein [Campylobacter sp. JMF_06 NA1]MDA3078003.1 hypothetical protein [Campylobacter sp. JMF_06 NA1]